MKGPTGLQYLKNAFANRYGPASNANTSLPLTMQWLSSVWNCKDQEWREHTIASLSLMSSEKSSHEFLPSTTLRSGGSFLLKPNSSSSPSRTSQGNVQPECKGEGVDLSVRLGLLKLVSSVSGLTEEALPETLMLNLSRLRATQAQIQKIIVSAISILICRQTILSERVITRPTDVEGILSRCIGRLLGILDSVEDACMEEIVGSISDFSINGNEVMDTEKVQSRKMVVANDKIIPIK